MDSLNSFDPIVFSEILYEKMKEINPAVAEMELYEFRYGLDNLYPKEGGWGAVKLDSRLEIEQRISAREYYDRIQIKPRVENRIVLDDAIVRLTTMLFVGLVTGVYPVEWINAHFYFDVRGFFFLTRTVYFSAAVLAHLGGAPFKRFEQKQKAFERCLEVGYQDFKAANAQVDQAFIDSAKKLIALKGMPILMAIAGPTAAGKTEIVERLRAAFRQDGKHVTSIELDHFLTDRDEREAKGIHAQGKQALHLALLQQSLEEICAGKKITIPRYDFVYATSSHTLDGKLKPGAVPIEIEPADIIFIEGNFPFLIEEIVHLIGLKVVYLTDDPVRLKRKWRRDIDYRKKYEPTYFRNRFFKDQFLMAQIAYVPQMQVCDLVVDTTGAALWARPGIAEILRRG